MQFIISVEKIIEWENTGFYWGTAISVMQVLFDQRDQLIKIIGKTWKLRHVGIETGYKKW